MDSTELVDRLQKLEAENAILLRAFRLMHRYEADESALWAFVLFRKGPWTKAERAREKELRGARTVSRLLWRNAVKHAANAMDVLTVTETAREAEGQ